MISTWWMSVLRPMPPSERPLSSLLSADDLAAVTQRQVADRAAVVVVVAAAVEHLGVAGEGRDEAFHRRDVAAFGVGVLPIVRSRRCRRRP
jgi:hypothetical protein